MAGWSSAVTGILTAVTRCADAVATAPTDSDSTTRAATRDSDSTAARPSARASSTASSTTAPTATALREGRGHGERRDHQCEHERVESCHVARLLMERLLPGSVAWPI